MPKQEAGQRWISLHKAGSDLVVELLDLHIVQTIAWRVTKSFQVNHVHIKAI